VRGVALRILGVDEGADWLTIRAAYRDLARRFQPDGTAPDPARMAEINRAYEALEHEQRRTSDGVRPLVGVGPGWPSPEASGGHRTHPAATARPEAGSLLERVERARYGETPRIDFGEYAGWRIADVARIDPQYLRWLSRHSAGVRYRAAIAEVLGEEAAVGRRVTIVR